MKLLKELSKFSLQTKVMKRVIRKKSRKNGDKWYNTVTTETNLRHIKTKDNITDFVYSAESENGKGENSFSL